jgi:predicted cupin superfamily sugar epimerase
MTADEIIAHFDMRPLPVEGGYYAESYRSSGMIAASLLRPAYSGRRNFGTAIYYLLTPASCSAIHQLPGDEVFHFYLGDPVEMLQLRSDGTGERILIGPDISAGMRLQVVVPGGVWQGARLVAGGRFALMGTTMAPGFDFADCTPGTRESLVRDYPAFAEIISALTNA